MEDPRKRQFRDIIDNVYHLNKRRFFHVRQIETETKRLQQFVADDSINHKKYEQLQKIDGYQWMLSQAQRQLQSECEKLEKFMKFNDDLEDQDCYKDAQQILEAARSQEEDENEAVN